MHDGYGFLVSHSALSQVGGHARVACTTCVASTRPTSSPTPHTPFRSQWFERSLQTVHADVSLAYWDYTIEGQRVTDANYTIAPFRASEVWQDDWFGPSETAHTGNVVATGRWAYTPVTKGAAAHNYSKYTNAYGMMRAPWNQNQVSGRPRQPLPPLSSFFPAPRVSDLVLTPLCRSRI